MKINWPMIMLLIFLIIFGYKYFANSTPNTAVVEEKQEISWQVDNDGLKERLKKIDLPALPIEGNALHTHQHLDVFVDGQKINIPKGIGVGVNEAFISPIHSHDNDGIIHVESPTITDYFLGQFFDIWGVKFDDQCINKYCTSGEKKLKVFVNGAEILTDFRKIKLESKQEIVIFYGTESQLPKPIPASYIFSEGN